MAQITFRCSDDEKKVWSELAEKDRRSLGDWIRLQIADASLLRGLRQSDQSVVHDLRNDDTQSGGIPLEHDFSKMEVVKRGPGRKTEPPMFDPKVRVPSDIFEEESAVVKLTTKGCNHKPFKRKDGLVVCENCGVRL